MADVQILFTGPMVRALLDGRKTMTRRVLKPQPVNSAAAALASQSGWVWFVKDDDLEWIDPQHYPNPEDFSGYTAGDSLWVRETWAVVPSIGGHPVDRGALYKADEQSGYTGPWRPSIFMPRWASRLTLTVTDVRVQRVQEISEEDARAEGVESLRADGRQMNGLPASDAFAELWDSINAARGFGWDANPWVVAVTFDVHRCNIDQMKEAV